MTVAVAVTGGRGCHVLKVLIAEDDLMIADLAEELLIASGYDVCGIARTVDQAIALVRLHGPDLAVIDMRLADGGLGTDIAARLGQRRRLGILFATGNAAHVISVAAAGDACLTKPYRSADLLRSLELVAEIVATGMAVPPFPRGFRLLNTQRGM